MKIFALNIGSTSTKIALFEGREKLYEGKVEHDPGELLKFASVMDQKDLRAEGIRRNLEEAGYSLDGCCAIVARCGGTGPIPGGTYHVNDTLIRRLTDPSTHKHNADLGGVLADLLAKQYGCKAYFVDSPETDELQPLARRHHVPHRQGHGREIPRNFPRGPGADLLRQVINAELFDSECASRCGEMQAMTILDMAYSGQDRKTLENRVNMAGGLMDHLGTADVMEIKRRIEDGDKYARYVYDGMIYQIGKYIGMMGAVLEGNVDAVLLTGGISRDQYLSEKLKKMCGYLAPVEVIAGEFEMEALAAGVYRVLTGEEAEKEYAEEFTFTGIEDLLETES